MARTGSSSSVRGRDRMAYDTLLLWVDTETTGLDPAGGRLLEIGLRCTDTSLNPLDGGFESVIRYEGAVSPFIQRMHGANGLLDACARPDAPTMDEAARGARAYVERWLEDCERLLPAGSSVGFDRKWLDRRIPGLLDGVHHRVFDVSVLDEAFAAWKPDVHEARPARTTDHRVRHCLDDSIRLAAWYRSRL